MPQEVAALAGILAALTVGVVSPGPSFVMVARMAPSRRPGRKHLSQRLAWVSVACSLALLHWWGYKEYSSRCRRCM